RRLHGRLGRAGLRDPKWAARCRRRGELVDRAEAHRRLRRPHRHHAAGALSRLDRDDRAADGIGAGAVSRAALARRSGSAETAARLYPDDLIRTTGGLEMAKAPLLLATALAALTMTPALAQAPVPQLGNVHFATSCNDVAQRRFDRAMRYQHSFWYQQSREIYQEAL